MFGAISKSHGYTTLPKPKCLKKQTCIFIKSEDLRQTHWEALFGFRFLKVADYHELNDEDYVFW